MGFLRLFLALCVIAGHSQTSVFGFLGVGAWYAVNWFFLISGFYMSMVLNEKYKDTPVVTFYKSRALRLYPTYFIGVILSLLVSGGLYLEMFSSLTPLSKIFFIVQNLFIFGHDTAYLACYPMQNGACINPIHMTINPPAWSLSVELIFYIIAPFVVKSPRRTIAFLSIGILYLLTLNKLSYPIPALFQVATPPQFFYYWYPSSFSFFAIGALSYQFSKGIASGYYLPILIAVVASSYTVTIMPLWQAAVIGLAIPTLFNLTKKNKVDRIIGELSFPAYILHWPVLVFVKEHQDSLQWLLKHVSLGSVVATISCAIGLLIYMTIEKRIDRFRHEELVVSKNGTVEFAAKFIIIPFLLIAPFASILFILSQ